MNANKKQLVLMLILCAALVLAACSQSSLPETPGTPPPSDPPVNNPEEENPVSGAGAGDRIELLERIIDLAEQGKVPGCRFTAGKTVFDEVEKEWGSADKTDYVAAAKGTYAVYESRGYVFGINKGYQVFEIRVMAKGNDLEEIRLSDVKRALGSPDKTLKYPGQDILGYRAGRDYKLEFVFSEASPDNSDPSLDHLNVLYPRGTINMMADDPGREW